MGIYDAKGQELKMRNNDLLLVIDMQNICVGEKHDKFFKYDNRKLIESVNEAIDNNKDNIIIYIRNLMKKNLMLFQC